MRIQNLSLRPYAIPMIFGTMRYGVIVHLTDDTAKQGTGEIAPLPKFSQETLEECLAQLRVQQQAILDVDWSLDNLWVQLAALKLYPAVNFGIESALLALLDPIASKKTQTAALLMGTPEEILELARLRQAEGVRVAKLKVGHLNFKDAKFLIDELQGYFRLRIDVNRAWSVHESLNFFSYYPIDAFDYVEEPFNDPHQLKLFSHPLAVDESYPQNLSLDDLEQFPMLKVLVYKPTIQGGLTTLVPLKKWTDSKGIQIVLSSSFESEIGLSHIASMAERLSLNLPLGIGTLPFFRTHVSCEN